MEIIPECPVAQFTRSPYAVIKANPARVSRGLRLTFQFLHSVLLLKDVESACRGRKGHVKFGLGNV